MGIIKDMRGRTFGRLTVPKDAKPVVHGGHAYWPADCECHTRVWVRGSKMRDGTTVSCKCWRADPDVRHAARVCEPEDHSVEVLEGLFDQPPEEIEEMFAQRASERLRGVRSGGEEQEREEAAEYMSARSEGAPDDLDEVIARAPAGPDQRQDAPQSPEEIDRAIFGEDIQPDVRHEPEPGKPEEEDWL